MVTRVDDRRLGPAEEGLVDDFHRGEKTGCFSHRENYSERPCSAGCMRRIFIQPSLATVL